MKETIENLREEFHTKFRLHDYEMEGDAEVTDWWLAKLKLVKSEVLKEVREAINESQKKTLLHEFTVDYVLQIIKEKSNEN